MKNPPDVRKLLEPDEGDTTFHYLQYESTEISHGNTRWKVYGSPVCTLIYGLHSQLTAVKGSPWYGGEPDMTPDCSEANN
jgi:hypothetical protein